MPYKDIEARRKWQRENNQRRRQEWLIQNGPCVECKSTVGLQVDHKDRSTKASHKVWSWSEARRNEELAKCQVLCKDCHQKKTNLENNKPIQHGTHTGHAGRGCRCVPCIEAHRVYKNAWRKKKLNAPLV